MLLLMTTTSTPTLTERIRNVDVRDPETYDVFELRPAFDKAREDLDLPEFDLPEFDTELFDRFDILGVRKAIADAEPVELTWPRSPADVISQMEDVRDRFEAIMKDVFENAAGLAPVTRNEVADLEQRVIAAEKAAKKATAKKATARKSTAKKAPARKATAEKAPVEKVDTTES